MAKSAARIAGVERGYADLREHIDALERTGLLVRVKREINKDTEMHPLVRWQYRGGLPEKDRKSTRLNSSHIQKSRMPSSA